MTIEVRTTISGKSGYIEVGEGEIDYFNSTTYTNTYLSKDYWRERNISFTIDVEKAKDMIELLTEYVQVKEGNA